MGPMLPCWASRTSCAITGLALLAAASAAAEEQHPQVRLVTGTFSESYLAHPVVVGNLLVGVRWGGRDGSFDPASVAVPVSPTTAGGTACVDVASKDGRYTAENIYAFDKDTKGEALLAMPTQYKRELAQYPLRNMAVMIRKASSCDPDEAGQIVPAILTPAAGRGAVAIESPGSGDDRELIADVNADAGKVALRLSGPRGLDLRADCRAADEGVRIAFSTRCRITVPDTIPAGTYALILAVRERFEKVETRFDLLLDGYP